MQEVEHGGYRRAIISRNPPVVDEDGYDIDSDDDDERVQDAVAAAAENDPYSTIRLAGASSLLTADLTYTERLTFHRITRPSDLRYRPPYSPHTFPTLHIHRAVESRESRMRLDAQGERSSVESPSLTGKAHRRSHVG